MTTALHKFRLLCPHCHSNQNLLQVTSQAIHGTGLRFNWRKRVAKREEKKKEVYSYVGENATKTSVVYAWGGASSGALGIASYLKPDLKFRNKVFIISKINRPARVKFFDIHRLKPLSAACGYGFTVFSVKSENRKILLGTGMNTDSQLGYHEAPKGSGRVLDQLIEPARIRLPLQKPDDCRVKSLACGRAHTVVVVEDEGIFSLGNNAYGQCGRSIVEAEDYSKNQTINRVRDLPEDVMKVVCGQDHSLFLTESGQVYSCGLGADGQTGAGHYDCVGNPILVKGDIDGEKIVSIGSRGDCSLAVSERGDVFGWGNSEYSQLGSLTSDSQVNVPRRLPLQHCGKVVKAISGGSICALLNEEGQVFVWGFGILGKGPELETSAEPSLIPEPIFGKNELSPDAKVVDIECGLTYVAALTDNGDVYTWGHNHRGCLGLGKYKNQYFPWRVSLAAEVKTLACGLDHMVTICKSFV